MRLPEVALTPAEVVQIWKENFVHFQPPSNHFYAGKTVVKPGDVLLINTELSSMPPWPFRHRLREKVSRMYC